MTDNESLLEDIQEDLKQIVQPYQRELNQKQRKADLIKQCIRGAGRDDFLQLDELLKSKTAEQIEADVELDGCATVFASLRAYADEKVERYRLQLIEDLTRLGEEADLQMEIDFPKFSVLKGIKGEIDFGNRSTKINKKTLKSIDPRRIVTAVSRIKRQLYDRPYDAQAFIDGLHQVYVDILKRESMSAGDVVPIQTFYLKYVLSRQSKVFFQDMDKGKFKGYSLEQFAVDLWRYFQAAIGGTSDDYELKLSPGRNKALWLIDSQGEERHITGISFQESAQ